MPLGDLGPCLGQPAGQRTGVRARFRVEDPNGDGRHRPSLAAAGVPTVRARRDTWVVPERRVRAYIGLGSNMGDSEQTLARAVHALAARPGTRLRGVSRLYATEPVGFTDQPEFRNAVVALDVPAGPDPATGALTLLSGLKALERSFGRVARARWGPRELDLDLLVFGRARLSVDRPAAARSIDAETDPAKAVKLLVVPHPAAIARLFVLAPLADLAPGLVPPGWGDDGRDRPPSPGTDRGAGGGQAGRCLGSGRRPVAADRVLKEAGRPASDGRPQPR